MLKTTKQAAKQTVQQPPTSLSSPSLGLLPSARPQKTARPLQDISSDHQVQAFFAGMTLDKEVVYWIRTLQAHEVIIETGEKGNHRRPLYGLGSRAHDYHKLHCFPDLIIAGCVGVDNWVFMDKHPKVPYPSHYRILPKSNRVKKAANIGRTPSPSSKSSAAKNGRGGNVEPAKKAPKTGRTSSASSVSSAANTGRKRSVTPFSTALSCWIAPQLHTRSITLKLILVKMRTEEEKMELEFIALNINYGSSI